MSLYASLERHSKATECYEDETGRRHVFDGDYCKCGAFSRAEHLRWSSQRFNGGVLVENIVAYLCEQGNEFWHGYAKYAIGNRVLTGVAMDEEAEPTDLAWISERVAREHPERVQTCKAGAVFVPDLGQLPVPENVIQVKNPRLAFTQAVSEFFPAPDDEPVIGSNVTVGPGTVLRNCIIGDNVQIGANCAIGLPGFGFTADEDGCQHRFPHRGKVLIGDNVSIGSNTCIDRGALGDTIIRRGAKIDNLVHVAHNVFVGENALVVAGSVLCGGVVVGANAWIGAGAMVREQIMVGSHALVGMGAVVVKHVGNGKTVMGNPARARE